MGRFSEASEVVVERFLEVQVAAVEGLFVVAAELAVVVVGQFFVVAVAEEFFAAAAAVEWLDFSQLEVAGIRCF